MITTLRARSYITFTRISNICRRIPKKTFYRLPIFKTYSGTQIIQCNYFSVHFKQTEDLLNRDKYSYNELVVAISNLNKSNDLNQWDIFEIIISNPRLTIKQRLKLQDDIWTFFNNSTVALQEKHFILKLKGYLICKAKVAPKEFLNEVKNSGIEPSENILKMLLAVVAEHGDQGEVSSVINAMKSRNYSADETVFSSLVIAHAVRRDMSSARQVLNTMKESGVSLGPSTYTSLMRAAVMAGDYAALHTYRTLAANEEIILSSENILSVLETIVRHGKEHLITSLKGVIDSCPTRSLLNMSDFLLFSGHASGGYSVLKLVDENDLTHFKEYVQSMFLAETPLSQLISVGKRLTADGTYQRALYDILEKKMMAEECEEALKVVEACLGSGLQVRPHFFWPMIVTAHRQNADQGVFQILEAMTSMEIKPDEETLAEVALKRLTLDDEDAVLKRLQTTCGLHISQIIVPYMSHLLRAGLLSQALNLGKRYKSSISNDSMPALLPSLAAGYRTCLDHEAAVSILNLIHVNHVGDWLMMVFSNRKWFPANELSPLFKELKRRGHSITSEDARWLIKIMSRNQSLLSEVESSLKDLIDDVNSKPSTTIMIHPSKMNTGELECHLIELDGKKGNTRGVLRKLLQQYCREGSITEARRTYKKLLDQNSALSPGILSSMLEVSIKAREVEDSLEFLRRLDIEFPEFRVDCYKIIDLAALFVSLGKFEDALNLLCKRSARKQSPKIMEAWKRNCWELLAVSATSGGVLAVKEMLNVLLKGNFCVPSNVILGPLIKAHLESGDVTGAVSAFCFCVSEYKKTPLQQELMVAALSNEDASLVNTIVSAAQKIHGVESANAALIAANAVRGDVDSLKRLLRGSGLEKCEQLKKQIVRMSELGQVEALRSLLAACLDTPNMDTDFIIERILHHYHRTGDTKGAIDCWSYLESQGVKLSDKQKLSLSTLVAATSRS